MLHITLEQNTLLFSAVACIQVSFVNVSNCIECEVIVTFLYLEVSFLFEPCLDQPPPCFAMQNNDWPCHLYIIIFSEV